MGLMNRLFGTSSALAALAIHSLFGEDKISAEWMESLNLQMEETMLDQTLGGRQFWGDVHNFRGWRIQQNVFTGHYRLIDSDDVRHARGSLDDCQQALKTIREKEGLEAPAGPAVILIHGLMRSSKCMSLMKARFEKQGFSTVVFDYPSTQISIPEAASYLNQLIQNLEGYDELNFVVHSMGGLVVRAYAKEYGDPRIKRMVMLGTPNHGAEMADITQRYWLIRSAVGPGARQLVTHPDGLIPQLPAPNFEFAVIAGARGNHRGWNPLIPGDDDGTVTVASTRLRGAADFATIRTLHTSLLSNDKAITHTINFIRDGRLDPEVEPQPIRVEQTCDREVQPAEAPADAR